MPSSLPFRAPAPRNFRLFCVAQGVSLVGTWVQQIAAAWLVFQLTGSAVWLGLAAFAGQIPAFALAPFAGVAAGRWDRHKVLLVTQALAVFQAFALAALAFSGVAAVWQVVLLNLFLGAVTALDVAARQAFLTQLVPDRDDPANTIALNSSRVNAARLVGPALAGVVLVKYGAGGCFLLNGVSHVAASVVLAAMRVPPREVVPDVIPAGEAMREGIAYAFGFPPVRAVLLLLAAVGVAGSAYATLLPAYAAGLVKEGDGAWAFGLLSAMSGAGALAAAVLASRGTVLGLGRWVAAAPAVFGFGLLGLSASGNVVAASLFLALAGFAVMAHMAATNAVLQTIAGDDKRGRVMSLYTAAFLGAAPVGSLGAGVLAHLVGVSFAFQLAGGGCVVAAAVFVSRLGTLRELVLPISVKFGTLPDPLPSASPATPVTVIPEAVG